MVLKALWVFIMHSQDGDQHPRAAILKLECTAECPEQLVKTARTHPQNFSCSRSEVGPESLHFLQVPGHC